MGMTVGVVGAGIGGLTAAAALQGRGIGVVVFERQSDVRDTGAGISLWPNALAALDSLGLGAEVRSAGAALASGGQRRMDGQAGSMFSRAKFESILGDSLVCVDRGELVRVLANRLDSGTVRTGCEVAGYDTGVSGVTVRITSGSQSSVDALVGADGVNSAVARKLNGPFRTSYSGYTAWRGIAEMESPDGDQILACLGGGHEFGWMPVAPGRIYWFATAWVPQGEEPSGGDHFYLRETFGHWPEPIPDLLAATPPERLVRNDILDRAALETWTHGPVTLLGDAAHPMRPHLGQGGCQAIEDAAVLANCLAASSSPDLAFRTYERRRRRRTSRVVRLSRVSGFTRPPGPVTTALDRLTNSLPPLGIGAALRMIAPVAGYRAGQRSTRPTST